MVFIKDYNVYTQPADSSTAAIALTTDGTKERPYGQLIWSPDSRYAVGYKMKIVEVGETHRLRGHLPIINGEVGQIERRGVVGHDTSSHI